MQTRLYLTPADHGRALSWDEFASADSEEGYRYEMIEGRVEVSPQPNMPHDIVLMHIMKALILYSAQHEELLPYVTGHGRVFLPDSPEGVTAPEPDIAGYTESFPEGTPIAETDWRNVSPAFVVEILSEGTEDKDLERNRRLYLRVSSIQEYWILDPREGVEGLTMLVYRRRGRRWAARITVEPGATYTTPMLPGFSMVLDPLA